MTHRMAQTPMTLSNYEGQILLFETFLTPIPLKI